MNTRYETMENGEWHPLKKKDQRTQCCDCRLTHREQYRIRNDGTIEVRVWRDNRATYAARKRAGIKVYQKK